MAGKIACFVVLCMVIAHAEALTCGQVTNYILPCLGYLKNTAPLGGCCRGVKNLASAAKSTPDRKTACTCLKSAAGAISGISYSKAAGLPSTCGVNIPYKISPSTDCSKCAQVDQTFEFV